MRSEWAEIICDPKRIRLTVAAVFAPGKLLDVVFLSDENCCRIPATG
jgi:hypothetical protein